MSSLAIQVCVSTKLLTAITHILGVIDMIKRINSLQSSHG